MIILCHITIYSISGAAHGLSSIILMLLSCPQFLAPDPGASVTIRGCVDFMLTLIQPNGNIPTAMDELASHRRPAGEELVHWCHGAPGWRAIL